MFLSGCSKNEIFNSNTEVSTAILNEIDAPPPIQTNFFEMDNLIAVTLDDSTIINIVDTNSLGDGSYEVSYWYNDSSQTYHEMIVTINPYITGIDLNTRSGNQIISYEYSVIDENNIDFSVDVPNHDLSQHTYISDSLIIDSMIVDENELILTYYSVAEKDSAQQLYQQYLSDTSFASTLSGRDSELLLMTIDLDNLMNMMGDSDPRSEIIGALMNSEIFIDWIIEYHYGDNESMESKVCDAAGLISFASGYFLWNPYAWLIWAPSTGVMLACAIAGVAS